MSTGLSTGKQLVNNWYATDTFLAMCRLSCAQQLHCANFPAFPPCPPMSCGEGEHSQGARDSLRARCGPREKSAPEIWLLIPCVGTRLLRKSIQGHSKCTQVLSEPFPKPSRSILSPFPVQLVHPKPIHSLSKSTTAPPSPSKSILNLSFQETQRFLLQWMIEILHHFILQIQVPLTP